MGETRDQRQTSEAAEREAKLAQALRANLRRRKAASKSAARQTPEEPGGS